MAPRKAQVDEPEMPETQVNIDPTAWVVRKPLRVGGQLYAQGEAPPPMSIGDAERYAAQGMLTQRGQRSPLQTKEPLSLQHYLRQSDVYVLRSLMEHPLDVDRMTALAELCRRDRRSEVLMTALEVIALYQRTAAGG